MTVRNILTRQSLISAILGLASIYGMGVQQVDSAFAKVVEVSMTAVETKLVIDGEGQTYDAWTFNGQFPGPVIRVQEGDEVLFSLTNPETNGRPHSMDFHAAKANFLEHYKEVRPGESLQYRFKAQWPGIFAYHCGASPMIQHIARGMMGAIIVDPKDPKAMPKADREYVLVQSELFKDPDDVDAMFDRKYQHVVFNGSVFRYDPVHSKAGGEFLEARPGERVRFYFVNAGPNNVSAVHPIAEIWSDVWESGNPANHTRGVQTQLIPPAGAAVLDMVVGEDEGVYPIVTHSLTDALRGAIALLKVSKEAKTLALMPFVEPIKLTEQNITAK